MLGRDSAGGRDLVRGGPHRPCVPAAVRAAPRRRSRGRPARDPCLRSRGREGDVVRCLRNHRLRLPRVLGTRSATVTGIGSPGGGEGARLSPGPERPPGLDPCSAIAHPSLGRGEETPGPGAAELRALQTTACDSASSFVTVAAGARPQRPAARSRRVQLPEREPEARAKPCAPFCALPAAPNCSRSPPGCGVPEPGGAGPVSGRGHSARRRSPAASGRSPPPPHVGRGGQQTWR